MCELCLHEKVPHHNLQSLNDVAIILFAVDVKILVMIGTVAAAVVVPVVVSASVMMQQQ